MKYLITLIVLDIVTFLATDAKKRPNSVGPKKLSPRTTTQTPLKWKKWNGQYPYSAKTIVKNTTELYYKNTRSYYKLIEITSNQTRLIDGSNRYRVQFNAAKCILKKQKKCKKK